MSLLSDFLQKPYIGLSAAADVLAYSKPLTQLLLWSTDATASGSTYPRLVLRNAGQSAGYGGEVHFQTNNSTPAVFVAAKIKGSLDTLTASSEVGRLELSAWDVSAYRGVAVKGGALTPMTHGVETLGASAAGFRTLYLYSNVASQGLTLDCGNSSSLSFTGAEFQVKSPSRVQNFVVSASGVAVFGASGSTAALLRVGSPADGTAFYSQSVGTTGYGVDVALAVPNNVTAEAAAVRVSGETASASFTLTSMIGVKVMSPVSNGASLISNAYGIFIQPQLDCTVGISMYAGESTSWGIVADGPKHYFAGPVLVSDDNWTVGASAGAYVDVGIGDTSGSLMRLTASNASYAETGGILRINGAADSSGYDALRILAAGETKLRVRGDGVVQVGHNAAQSDQALLTVVGRCSIGGQDTYDLAGDTRTVDVQISGTHSPPQNKLAMALRVDTTAGLGNTGTSAYGIVSVITASANVAGTVLYGAYLQASSAYAGEIRGLHVLASATSGNTGTAVGVRADVDSQAGTTSAIGVAVKHTGRMHYGVHIDAGQAGAQLDHGVYVGNASDVDVSAFTYFQRSGSTADLLRYLNSSGVATFQVTHSGNILSPNLDTFDNGDVALGPGNLTTAATAGHAYLPAVAGVMTGVPTNRPGWAPVVVDTTNHKIGIYSGGSWRWTAALT